MKPDITRRLIGALATLFGAWWTWTVIVPPITRIWSDRHDSFDIAFLLTIVPMMSIPGVIAVVFGVRLFREMQESSLRWVTGVFAILFAFFLSSRASELLPSLLPESIQSSIILLVASLIAIGSYLFVVRLLLRHFSKENRSFCSLLSRGVLILMAWQVWLLLTDVFDEYSPIKEGYTHLHQEPWDTLGFLLPIIVAYGSYRILASKLAKAQQGGSGQPATRLEFE